MAKKAKPSSLTLVTPGWTMVSSPVVRFEATGRRDSAGAPVSFIPGYLRGTDFEIVQTVVLRSAPGRRQLGAGPANEFRMHATRQSDSADFLVVRQESGAISFHQPEAGILGPPEQTSFQVSLRSQSKENARRGFLSRTVKVALIRIGKAALEAVAKAAVPFLASKLEERLWKDRQLGWLRVTDTGLASKDGRMISEIPRFTAPQRGLLLLHGTFSHTHSAFGRLAGTGFFDQLQPLYGSNIYAFNYLRI